MILLSFKYLIYIKSHALSFCPLETHFTYYTFDRGKMSQGIKYFFVQSITIFSFIYRGYFALYAFVKHTM